MFREESGKLSLARVTSFWAFIFACILSLVIVGVAAFTSNQSFGPNVTPIVFAFLTYAGGAKGVSKFAEYKDKKTEEINMKDAQ
jgi:hypothetical protein